MTDIISYLTDIAILLAAAVLVVPLSQFLRMGAVPGFIIAGVVVGPYGLEFIGNVEEIRQLSMLGVVLLLFIIGIELKPTRLWMMRRLLFGLGTLQFLCTSVVFVVISHFLFGIPLRVSIFIGPALALSSTTFVLQLLTENKMLTSERGRASIAILLLQDLAVIPLLALVSLLTIPGLTATEDVVLALGEAVLIIGLVILVGRYLLQPILHRVAKSQNPEVFTAFSVLLVLGTALLAEQAGLSMAMGAFMAGLLIADSSFRHQVIAETQPFRRLLLGLFFMSMGMTVDLVQLFHQPVFLLSLVAALVILKAIVIWPLAHLFGLSWKSALAVALLLAQSGEFALVVFAAALGAGLLDGVIFQQLLLVVMISMLVTPLLAKLAGKLKKPDEIRHTIARTHSDPENSTLTPVLIIGFGQVGSKIGRILDFAKVPFLAIDNNPTLVALEHDQGHPVFYGGEDMFAVLKQMGVEAASIVIIALENREIAEQIVSTLRENFPELMILVSGHDFKGCEKLKALGADVVISETLETSIDLARIALTKANTPEDEISSFIENFRSSYYDQ